MLKQCLFCQVEFKTYQTAVNYCSRKCVNAAKRAGIIRYKNAPDFVTKTCPCCNKEFLANLPGHASIKYAPHIRIYCSHQCANKAGKYIGSKSVCHELSPTEAAYIAGFTDGEGCISVYQRGKSYAIKIAITNTCLPVMEYILAVTGGGSYKSRKTFDATRHKQSYIWVANADFARTLLEKMLPYLIVKAEQARLAIELQSRIPDFHDRLDKAWQHDYFLRVKKLNSRGPSSTAGN